MIRRKTWEEFRNTGLLLLLNQFLHIFGWAIVLNMENGKVIESYPARVKFRGFSKSDSDEAYIKITNYMSENADELKKDIEDE
jgi:hypothetical protein